MRCSLLALSSYIDTELDMEPAGELEAHLVACDRCRTALGYLREESQRIAGLARVHLPDDAVHALFSQVGLIGEGDDLPAAPAYQDRPASVEAPPWFGVERGKALPWAPRPSATEATPSSGPRELIGERSPGLAIADPPELFLWDEPGDEAGAAQAPLPFPEPAPAPPPIEPQPPEVAPAEPQPPALTNAQPPALEPPVAGAPGALQRMRDALAVRLALWRGGSHLDSDIEIVSGAGAPRWNERAHPKAWSESPAVVAIPDVAIPDVAVPDVAIPDVAQPVPPPLTPPQPEMATAPPELADVLNEVAILAAPLERTHGPAAVQEAEQAESETREDFEPEQVEEPVIPAAIDSAEPPAPAIPEPFRPRGPGRHMRRLKSQRPDRRTWTSTEPVTGRHVLPLGGPAVAAADRDRRLWVFGAATAVVLVLGLLVGRQVVTPGAHATTTVHRPAPTAHASAPPTEVPLPIATPLPVITIPPAPSPAQLTGSTKLGSGSEGFSVADVRYGQHPNDFRIVFDLAFPDTVTGAPTTVVGYDGTTTLYVEFTGVTGTAPIASPPPGQVVASIVPLPMARTSDRLIFKITLRHKAPYDAYYLSGGRLIIDVT